MGAIILPPAAMRPTRTCTSLSGAPPDRTLGPMHGGARPWPSHHEARATKQISPVAAPRTSTPASTIAGPPACYSRSTPARLAISSIVGAAPALPFSSRASNFLRA